MNDGALIPNHWTAFPEALRARLGSSVGRQRLMIEGKDILIVAHMVPEHDEKFRRGVLFWRDSEARWSCSNGDPGHASISMHLQRFSEQIDIYEQEESAASQANDYLHLLEGIAPLSRCMRNFLDVMEEARREVREDRSLIDNRDRAYDLSRQAELLYEDAKNAMDVAVIRRADEQAAATHQMTVASHRLNLLAALFFPFATLGAIFGTTLTDNWPWSENYVGFVIFLVVGILFGLVLAGFVSRPAPRRK